MPTEVLKNNIQTTLLAAIDSNDAVITPTDPTGFPATGEQARAAIGDELLIVAGGDGPQYDVTRGAEGTTAVGHAAGDAVRLVLTAAALTAIVGAQVDAGAVTLRETYTVSKEELWVIADTPVAITPSAAAGRILVPSHYTSQYTFGTRPFFNGDEDIVESAYGHGIIGLEAYGASFRCGGPASHIFDLIIQSPNAPLTVTAPANYDQGTAGTATTTAGGAGYSVDDLVTDDAGNVWRVVTETGGAIETVTLETSGATPTADGATLTALVGGWTATAGDILRGDGSLTITVTYQDLAAA